MRIGVPSATFDEFVDVTIDPITNTCTVNGFCIEIFDAVMKELSYARDDYEYIPFSSPDGNEAAGNTDELVLQVFKGNYDIVVGDVTITAYRSVRVDFTLPYIQSEVLMLVRIKDDKNSNAMAFLTPLTPSLWTTTFCFFLFIAFVIWVLEHRINDDFRGSPSYQAGTSLWFAFSIMVFAHRERVINNLARAVIIVWSFVLLILTQSYTASFSSLLTVDQLHPAVTDIQELILKQEYVGYLNNSFVFGVLKGLGFKESSLVAYDSPEQCDRLLSLGRKTGGIAAAFDESPYMKIILARNFSNYTLVQPSTTGGFGFVFPKGSPLVSDVSRAILKVTQDIGMQRIEDTWINDDNICPDKNNSISSRALGLDSFWGLFLIAGAVSFSALLIYIAMFVYAQREIMKSSGSEASFLSRMLLLLKIFYQKDPKADAVKENNITKGRVSDVITRQQVATTFGEHTILNLNNEQTSDEEIIPLSVELMSVNQDGTSSSQIQDLADQQICDHLGVEITGHVDQVK
ncbi:glutamate receptor 2.2 [Euphorbia peplus]|nr:glutamate receptor 2.2 [Euphorbia peplus]